MAKISCTRVKVADVFGILENAGAFFTVDFTKKDGSPRTMNARFLKDHTRARYINGGEHHTCLTVWDLTKKAFRQIPLDRVHQIRANRKVFLVTN